LPFTTLPNQIVVAAAPWCAVGCKITSISGGNNNANNTAAATLLKMANGETVSLTTASFFFLTLSTAQEEEKNHNNILIYIDNEPITIMACYYELSNGYVYMVNSIMLPSLARNTIDSVVSSSFSSPPPSPTSSSMINMNSMIATY
jgi:hypothetical protein